MGKDRLILMDEDKSNLAKGRDSFDATIGNNLVQFFNKNITPYPTEVGAPKFDLVPVTKQKDIMVNVARLHAQQEYDRIMQLVEVLQKQAQEIKRRLDLTNMVNQAKYDFQTYHGQFYWLVFDHKKNFTRLTLMGPKDWSTGKPEEYEYICRVKWLGDYTWLEVDNEGNPI
jgi:hypothetical protein